MLKVEALTIEDAVQQFETIKAYQPFRLSGHKFIKQNGTVFSFYERKPKIKDNENLYLLQS